MALDTKQSCFYINKAKTRRIDLHNHFNNPLKDNRGYEEKNIGHVLSQLQSLCLLMGGHLSKDSELIPL